MKSWVWLVLLVGLMTLVWVALEVRARSLEGRWSEFVEKWESKGEAFGVEANLPPALPDLQEFAAHPWIQAIATGDRASLAQLAKMNPESVEGYEAWQSSAGEDGVLPTMPEDLAERVRIHGEEFQTDLAAFEEALGRPGYRVLVTKPSNSVANFLWVNKLAAVSKLLDALAHAAIARDDSAAFSRFTVMQLKAGEKLRGTNSLMGLVVGAGFESSAYTALGSIPASRKWPNTEMEKWIAALDLRKRPPADEFAAALRAERGLYLETIATLEKSPAVRISVSRLLQIQRRYFAQSKLALCEELQEAILSHAGKLLTSIDPARWKRFGDDMAARKNEATAEEFGHAIFYITRGIFEALALQEIDRAVIRAKLEDELRIPPR